MRKGQGRKPKLNNRDLRSLRRHCIKNRHSSISDITTWAQDYFGKPCQVPQYVVTSTMPVKTVLCQKEAYVNSVQKRRRLSGLGGIWDGPSHSGNVYCGQMNQYSGIFWEEWTPCAPDQRRKGSSRLLPATSPKARVCHGMGCVSALGKGTCTSVMAPLMLKST